MDITTAIGVMCSGIIWETIECLPTISTCNDVKKATASETEIAKEALWEQKTFTCNDIKTQRFQKAKMAKVRFGNKWDGLEGRSHLIYGAFLRRGHVIRIHEI